MRRSTVAVLGMVLLSSALGAQTRAPEVAYGLFGGASSPLGDFADGARTGFHLGARLGVQPRSSSVGAHAELQWHRFATKPAAGSAIGRGPYDVFPAIANIDIERRSEKSSLYLTAGAGIYRRFASAEFTPPDGPRFLDSNDTRVGVNAGVGATFDVGRRRGFVELRVHRVGEDDDQTATSMSFAPISVGIRF